MVTSTHFGMLVTVLLTVRIRAVAYEMRHTTPRKTLCMRDVVDEIYNGVIAY